MATMDRRSSSSTNFANGLILNGKPLVQAYSGKLIFVDSNGGGGSGTAQHPVTTLSAALDLVTSGNGDIIFVKEGHAETIASTVSSSKSNYAIVGLGRGSGRPVFTNGLSGTTDAFSLTGDNVAVQNIYWNEASSGTTITVFNISGSFFVLEGNFIELGAASKILLTHDTTAKEGFTMIDNVIVGTAAGCTKGVDFEKLHNRSYFSGNKWIVGASSGLDTGCVIYTSGAGDGHIIDGDVVVGQADGEKYLVTTVNQTGSLCMNMRIMGADATDNLGDVDSFGFINCFVTEDAKGVPSEADYAGARPPGATPAT